MTSELVSIFHNAGGWPGTPTTRQYDALDRLTSTSTTDDVPSNHQYTFTYDAIGNVLAKDDVLQSNLTENFTYESRNFLTGTSGTGFTSTSTNYDATGNISYKSNVGTYNYPATSSPQPHAPSSITGTVINCSNPSFGYDLNGNLQSGLGRTYTYTSYNMPSRIVGTRTCGGTSYQYDYTYGPEHQRTKLVHSTAGTFVYLNPGAPGELFFEKEIQPGGLVINRHYISAGGRTIGMYISRSNGSVNYRFFHHDQVRSILMVTNGGGTFMEGYAYEAFGKRRNTNGTDDTSNTVTTVQTRRGFTSHEELDEIGLVHMNGRIYDPVIAKFITPDPFVQDSYNPASYNRYAYVNNNPLAYTDPSGYIHVFGADISGQDIRTIASIAVTIYLGYGDFSALGLGSDGIFGAQTLATSMTAGFAGGIVGTGTLDGGVHGAISGALAYGADSFASGMSGMDGMGGADIWGTKGIGYAATQAVAGCIGASASGGQCGPAAAAAGFSTYASGYFDFKGPAGAVGASVVGGTASVIGGGKFGNGATTAAFAYIARGALSNDGSNKRTDSNAGDATPQENLQVAQVPPTVFFGRPPVTPIPPEELAPLDTLPLGSAGGPGANKAFPRSFNAEQPEGVPCTYCGRPTTREPGPDQLQGDHVIPRSQGGNNTRDNYTPSCARCNGPGGKWYRTPQQWYKNLGIPEA